MNFELFLGRFHPVIVHLPIGFLLLAAIMEWLSHIFKDKFRGLDAAVSIAILCGCFGAIGSSIIGYLLAGGGGYDDDTLFWHKWLGIGLAIFSFFGWAVKLNYIRLPKKAFHVITVLLVVWVSLTGHLGGNLTHGSTYLLQYAPEFVQNLAGLGSGQPGGENKIPSHPDSVVIFSHLVEPILTAKCSNCHNEIKAKGALNLTTHEGILKGGDHGEVLEPGNPDESELFIRVTSPQSDKKFMPPRGDPLTYSELRLLEWWIENGTSFETRLTDTKIPKEIQALLLRDFKIDTKPKPYFETVQVPQLTAKEVSLLENTGWRIAPLYDDHHFIQVKANTKTIGEIQMQTLLSASHQITWIDLDNLGITDDMLVTIGKLTNLTNLKLSRNRITDKGLENLRRLDHLESLNLYGTEITDGSISTLKQLHALKRLYVWKTKVTANGIQELKKELPTLIIVLGEI